MLLFAANAFYAFYEARRKKFFFIRGARVSARTGQAFSALIFVLLVTGAFLIFFGPWPKRSVVNLLLPSFDLTHSVGEAASVMV